MQMSPLKGHQDGQGSGAHDIGERGQGLSSLKKGRFRRRLTAVYNCLIGGCKDDGVKFFLVLHSGRITCKIQKLEHGKF